MPECAIIDTHLHVWDMSQLRYSAFEANPRLNRSFHVEDYARDCGRLEVEAMVFIECYADFDSEGGQYLEEVRFVEDEASRDARLRGIVPMAPLERGRDAMSMLEKIHESDHRVKGIRRIIEFDDDPRALALSDDFIEGVGLLEKYDWHFEINVNHTQMDIVREFVPRLPGVRMVLDHCGKPGIAEGALEQYRADLAELSQYPNLCVKLSGLPTRANADHWTVKDILPFIATTLDCFGPERTMFGGDYPICLRATTMQQWVDALDQAFAELGLSDSEIRKIYRDNANGFYRLGL